MTKIPEMSITATYNDGKMLISGPARVTHIPDDCPGNGRPGMDIVIIEYTNKAGNEMELVVSATNPAVKVVVVRQSV